MVWDIVLAVLLFGALWLLARVLGDHFAERLYGPKDQ
jgi:hypothetical protein